MTTGVKQDKPQQESVLFQPVPKAYPTWHSWIITAHISIHFLNKQLCMFNCQKALAQELLIKLQWQPFASNFVFNALLGEVSNIYQSYEPIIWTAIQLLKSELLTGKLLTLDNPQSKRSLLSFLGDALHWLTGMASTKDTTEIKQWVNSLIQKQTLCLSF